jgi:hypothetical protein
MGAALWKATRVPVQLDSWESLVGEAQRLEESLRGLVREVREGRDLFLKSRVGSIKSQVIRIRGPLTVCARGDPEKLEWIHNWFERLQDLQLILSTYAEITLTPIAELE